MYSDSINLLKTLIKTPSVSRNEDKCADIISNYLISKGVVANRKCNNIWAKNRNFDISKPTILLNSHIDTVPDSNSWSKPPYKASCEDGKIYGLGSNDAGASVVSLLATFIHFYSKEINYNLIYLATAEEEVSGKNGAESIIPDLGDICFAIVGEPTGMDMAIAEKGLMVLDCTAKGKSGHAARDEGINAIEIAMRDIERIKNLNLEKTSELLGETKLTVTLINAGSKHNVVPDICTFVVDVRTNEHYSNREIHKILSHQLESDVVARSFRLNSSSIDSEHTIVKTGKQLGLKTYGSPTLSDQALMNFPTLKMGPGDSARSHTADEYIVEREITDAIDIYKELLSKIL